MTRQMMLQTKAGILALMMIALAGCGNRDQAGSSTVTSAQIEQNAQKQNQPTNNPAAANGKSTTNTSPAPAAH